MSPLHTIFFVTSVGEEYVRLWYSVPRVGDFVELLIDDVPQSFVIRTVTWHPEHVVIRIDREGGR